MWPIVRYTIVASAALCVNASAKLNVPDITAVVGKSDLIVAGRVVLRSDKPGSLPTILIRVDRVITGKTAIPEIRVTKVPDQPYGLFFFGNVGGTLSLIDPDTLRVPAVPGQSVDAYSRQPALTAVVIEIAKVFTMPVSLAGNDTAGRELVPKSHIYLPEDSMFPGAAPETSPDLRSLRRAEVEYFAAFNALRTVSCHDSLPVLRQLRENPAEPGWVWAKLSEAKCGDVAALDGLAEYSSHPKNEWRLTNFQLGFELDSLKPEVGGILRFGEMLESPNRDIAGGAADVIRNLDFNAIRPALTEAIKGQDVLRRRYAARAVCTVTGQCGAIDWSRPDTPGFQIAVMSGIGQWAAEHNN